MNTNSNSVEDFLSSGKDGFRSDTQDAYDQTSSSTSNELQETSSSGEMNANLTIKTPLYTSSCLSLTEHDDDDDDDDDDEIKKDIKNEDVDDRLEISLLLNNSIDRGCTAQATVYRGSKLSNDDKLALREYCEKLNEEVKLTQEMKFILNKTEIHKMSK
jgi:hypothetical protein